MSNTDSDASKTQKSEPAFLKVTDCFSILNDAAHIFLFNKMRAQQRQQLLDNVPNEYVIRLTSSCSGSGVYDDAAEALCSTIATETVKDVRTHTLFTCDRGAPSQQFLEKHEKLVAQDACHFHKMEHLLHEEAECRRHGKMCKVPLDPDSHSCGFACTALSHYHQKHHINIGSMRKQTGNVSVDTFVYNLTCMNRVRDSLQTVAMENAGCY